MYPTCSLFVFDYELVVAMTAHKCTCYNFYVLNILVNLCPFMISNVLCLKNRSIPLHLYRRVADILILVVKSWVSLMVVTFTGVDPGYFLGGGAPLMNSVTDW